MKRKKKKGSRGTKLSVGLIALAFLAIGAIAVMHANPSINQTMTSQTPSISSQSLSVKDFSIVPMIYICVNGNNGFKFASLRAQLQNDKNMTFRYVSGTIIFANYTLANGTVITVNQQWADSNQTFDTTHAFNLLADFNVPNSGMKITNVDFVITAKTQEVAQPIIQLVSFTTNC
jgi:hypothetical protein